VRHSTAPKLKKVCPGNNGVFAPTIVHRRQGRRDVESRSIGKSAVEIVASPFGTLARGPTTRIP